MSRHQILSRSRSRSATAYQLTRPAACGQESSWSCRRALKLLALHKSRTSTAASAHSRVVARQRSHNNSQPTESLLTARMPSGSATMSCPRPLLPTLPVPPLSSSLSARRIRFQLRRSAIGTRKHRSVSPHRAVHSTTSTRVGSIRTSRRWRALFLRPKTWRQARMRHITRTQNTPCTSSCSIRCPRTATSRSNCQKMCSSKQNQTSRFPKARRLRPRA